MMIGADEITVLDKYYNTVFVTGGPDKERRRDAYLREGKQLGFEVSGTVIDAFRDDIHLAMFKFSYGN